MSNGGDKNRGQLSTKFNTFSEASGQGNPAYRRNFRSQDQRWKERNNKPIQAAIFGISTGSEFATTKDKLDVGLQAILEQIDHLYISNTYGPYQHVFIKQGMSTEAAQDQAFNCASEWLTDNTNIIYHYKKEATKHNKSVRVIDWIDEIQHGDEFMDRLTQVHEFYMSNEPFRDAIKADIQALWERQLKRGDIKADDIPDDVSDTSVSVFNPYISSALEKIAGYWMMADSLKKKTGCDEIAYFHNGAVSPQIDFFRTNPEEVPEAMKSLTSLVYVDISFKSRKNDQEAKPEIDNWPRVKPPQQNP